MKPIQYISSAILATLALAAPAQDVTALLKASDKFRMSAENLQVQTQISVLNASAEIMQRWLDFFRKAETTNPGTLTALLSALPIGPIDPEWKP